MANPTTNYGWPMPTATDLVTDLPADFAAFGQPVDTSLKALNPETTLGDIAYRSATSNTNTRLAIGSSSQVLTVAGGVPTWATPTAGGMTTLGTGTLSGASVTISSIPGTYVNLQLDVYNMTASTNSAFLVTVNGLSSDYAQSLYYHANTSSGNSGTGSGSQWDFTPASTFDATSDANHLQMTIYNYAATNRVALASSTINYLYGDGTTKFSATGSHANTAINAAITSVTVAAQSGTFSGGTYILRGVK